MQVQRLSGYLGVTISAILAASTSANAFSFNSGTALGDCGAIPLESLSNNSEVSISAISTCTTADGFTLTTNGGVLTQKEVNGVTGVGIYDDLHPDGSLQEIDFGETLTLSVDVPSIFTSLDLSALYKKKTGSEFVFGDIVNEVATIKAGGITGTLSVLGNNTAEWSWNGITQILSGSLEDPASSGLGTSTSDGGGLYRILNPFGDTAVSSVELTSSEDGNYTYSDFSLSGAEATDVPEPSLMLGTVAMLGGFGLLRRR